VPRAGLVASLVAIAALFPIYSVSTPTCSCSMAARAALQRSERAWSFLRAAGADDVPAHADGTAVIRLNAAISSARDAPALFLSFSRAAWGQFAFAAAGCDGDHLCDSRAPSERLRIALIAIMGTLVDALLVAALLSIGQVA